MGAAVCTTTATRSSRRRLEAHFVIDAENGAAFVTASSTRESGADGRMAG